MSSKFVHLHVHTEYSLLDGAQRIKSAVNRAVQLEMPALAITDHGTMHGALDFYQACLDENIKPIIGIETYVAPESHKDKTPIKGKQAYHLVLLAKDMTGYKNLLKLASIAYLDGFYYKPRIDKALLAEHSEGLIGLSACLAGEIPSALLNDDYPSAIRLASQYADILGKDNFYIEIQDHNLEDEKRIREPLIKLANELKLPMVATNDAHYLNEDDDASHDVLLCIQTQKTINDSDRLYYGKGYHLTTEAEMYAKFTDLPNALASTLEIADRCNLEIPFGVAGLPIPDVPNGLTPHEYVTELCKEALPKLFKPVAPDVVSRLEYELDVIQQTGFSSYFLIVRDFAMFSRQQNILIGVRGSAAGSLVSYCLGITDIDPMKYGLTFERFLNPERISMPDIDMDIEDARREDVIEYVSRKYGSDRVAQIITFGTMMAKAAIRDAGRALAMPLPEVDRVAKQIPSLPVGITIEQAVEANTDLKNMMNANAQVRKLITTAQSIEGMPRNTSIHAAGVVISQNPLTDVVPLLKGANGEIVTQYSAANLEKLGLLKMDFLGLANLSVLAKAIENIKQSRNIEIDIHNIPLDDNKAYAMLSNGDVVGVFQLEGGGMRRHLMELKPQNISELAAMVALYRPGPMAQIPKYIKSKFGLEQISYIHPDLKPILEETYGVIVYQDQVLRIVQAIAGFSLGQADIMRKAMGKKQKETMEKMRAKFLDGAVNKGCSEKKAIEIFELIEPFAGYAFNKAHATCYGMVAYQTAYLKANYPAEFMAALMAVYREKEEKIAKGIEECKRLNINILAPDINASEVDFTFEQGSIRFGLGAIKGVGDAAVEGILQARKTAGKFENLFDFCVKVRSEGHINRATVEALIKAGCFDELHSNRLQILDAIETALAYADRVVKEKEIGQENLFGEAVAGESSTAQYPPLPPQREAQPSVILAMEKEVLGVYISDHPLRAIASALMRQTNNTIDNLNSLNDEDEVVVGGIITNIRNINTRTGKKMASLVLEDLSGQVNVTVFQTVLEKYNEFIVKDNVVLVKGRISVKEKNNTNDDTAKEVEVRANEIHELNLDIDDDSDGTVVINLSKATKKQLCRLKNIINNNPGACQVLVEVRIAGGTKRVVVKNRIECNAAVIQEIESVLNETPGNKLTVSAAYARSQNAELAELERSAEFISNDEDD